MGEPRAGPRWLAVGEVMWRLALAGLLLDAFVLGAVTLGAVGQPAACVAAGRAGAWAGSNHRCLLGVGGGVAQASSRAEPWVAFLDDPFG